MNPALPDLPESVLPGPLLIVEDELPTQRRLAAILTGLGYQAEALQFAGDIAAARALLAEQPFAMVLADVGLPDGSGIDLIRELFRHDPALPILVISAWSTEQIIVTALQAGATGYLLKERDDIEIALSIRSALRGGAPIDPFVARRILDLAGAGRAAEGAGSGVPAAPPGPSLSPREIEILGLVGKGLTNREISEVLSLSRLTVECHIKNIYKKLAVNSRTQAVFEARTQGWLP
ncbi:response regulator transcription factor [Paraburkholderia acidipaludis]|uniref:response regulator transcription factor n=1 Tax=Paraburkholderia acidipaludis TaxID=660537 RepID=UPI00048011D8|nr:response regulator transcription factor [Paraburkholderia acidipaludis]